MAVDREGRKVFACGAVLVHVAAHQQGVEGHEGDAVCGFVVGIGGGRQGAGDSVVELVGHLFDADGDDVVVSSGCDRQVGGADRCSASGAGSFDLEGFDGQQTGGVSHHRGDVFLARELSGKHVADVQRAYIGAPRIAQRPEHRLAGEVTQRAPPMLGYGRLPDSNDSYFTHLSADSLLRC